MDSMWLCWRQSEKLKVLFKFLIENFTITTTLGHWWLGWGELKIFVDAVLKCRPRPIGVGQHYDSILLGGQFQGWQCCQTNAINCANLRVDHLNQLVWQLIFQGRKMLPQISSLKSSLIHTHTRTLINLPNAIKLLCPRTTTCDCVIHFGQKCQPRVNVCVCVCVLMDVSLLQ